MYELTDGRVNVAMGPVLSLWHQAREASLADPQKAYIPSEEDLEAAAQRCGIEGLFIDKEKRKRLVFQNEAVSLSMKMGGFHPLEKRTGMTGRRWPQTGLFSYERSVAK